MKQNNFEKVQSFIWKFFAVFFTISFILLCIKIFGG